MEENRIKSFISGKQIQMTSRKFSQKNSFYFELYEAPQNGTLCLVENNMQKSKEYVSTIINRLSSCRKNISQYQAGHDLDKFSIIGQWNFQQTMIDNKPAVILFYKQKNSYQSLKIARNKLQQTGLLSLAEQLIKLVVALKDIGFYFGNFNPSYIFVCASQSFDRYYIKPSQLFCPASNISVFYSSNHSDLKNHLKHYWKYQPPQIFKQGSHLNYSSDLFSVGCLIFQLITGQYPFRSFQSLLKRQVNNKYSNLDIIKEITRLILLPDQHNRVQPQQLLHLIELEKSKTIFKTCKLSINLEQSPKQYSFFENFQEFIIKCTTQTEGWFLYFIQNSAESPNQKYLQLILSKLCKKKQKLTKLTNLIEKCSNKQIKQTQIKNINFVKDDNTYSIIKMGALILGLLSKLPYNLQSSIFVNLEKHVTKLCTKKSENALLPIIFKIIVFKVKLSAKFPQFSGNFHIRIEEFQKITIQGLDYLAQYSLKLLTYLRKLSEGEVDISQKLTNCEKYSIKMICDEVYQAISSLFFLLISIKKDKDLGLSFRKQCIQNIDENIKLIDKLCSQIIQAVNKLCSKSSIFSAHSLYSIGSDYYEYQEELCLLYNPIETSYQYFYLDNQQYKGLRLPKNYSLQYENSQIIQQKHKQKYLNRSAISGRFTSSNKHQKINDERKKPNTNSQKLQTTFQKEKNTISNMKSQGSNYVSPKIQHKISPQKKNQQKSKQQNITKADNHIQEFLFGQKKSLSSSSKSHSDALRKLNSTQASTENLLANEIMEMNPTCQTSWFQPDDHDIFSYEWLKKTEKVISKHFSKPQVDSIIYLLYQQICKGLKLQELIEALTKNKKMIVDPNQILFQRIIGSGSAGDVYIGKYRQQIVAIKKVKITSNPNALKQFERQVLTYIKIKSHPSLVSLVGLTKFNEDYFLLTEFCQGGSLFQLLHKKANEVSLTWSERISIALDIAKGMEVLHFMNPPVIHRDMKSLNVFMVKSKNKWAAKVADFGLSRSPDAEMMTSALGTLHWMAPELLCNKKYSVKVDVYSFAIVLWQICSRRTPYHNIGSQMGIVKYVALQKGRPLLQLIQEGCPKQLIALMEKCWSQQAEDRPFFPQIIKSLAKIIS